MITSQKFKLLEIQVISDEMDDYHPILVGILGILDQRTNGHRIMAENPLLEPNYENDRKCGCEISNQL